MQFPDEPPILCAQCQRPVDEFEARLEGWQYWSDGSGELIPFCPECTHTELASALLAGEALERRADATRVR